jgi:hypothetical protein
MFPMFAVAMGGGAGGLSTCLLRAAIRMRSRPNRAREGVVLPHELASFLLQRRSS